MIIWIAHLLQKYVGYFLVTLVPTTKFKIKDSAHDFLCETPFIMCGIFARSSGFWRTGR